MAKVKFMLDEATNRRGCLIELPWAAGSASFTLTCQWESSYEEPVWTLYEQDGSSSKVVWTQSFAPSDLEFMYDILAMSAPKTTAFTAIPELLKPEVSQDDSGDRRLGGDSAISGGYPMMAPLPQPGMPPVPAPQQQQSYSNLQTQGGQGGMAMVDPHQPYPGMPYPPHPGYPPQAPPPQGYNPYGMPQQMPPQMQPYPPQQYPPGYPPPQQMPPQMQPMPQQMPPQTMPPSYPPPQVAPQIHPGGPAGADSPRIPLDYHLLDKRPNMLLGSMLQEAGLISEPTLEAALKLQELIRDEKIPPERAPAILKRLHSMGGNIDQYLTPDDTIAERRRSSEKVQKPAAQRPGGGGGGPSGAPAGASGAPAPGPDGKRNLKPAFDLLQKAGILSEDDIQDALAVRKKHGGDLVGILEAAGKVNRKTVDAAFICLPLVREGLLKMEQCIIALNYCSRMRVGFDEALDEMGWQNPRKLRSDLPL